MPPTKERIRPSKKKNKSPAKKNGKKPVTKPKRKTNAELLLEVEKYKKIAEQQTRRLMVLTDRLCRIQRHSSEGLEILTGKHICKMTEPLMNQIIDKVALAGSDPDVGRDIIINRPNPEQVSREAEDPSPSPISEQAAMMYS